MDTGADCDRAALREVLKAREPLMADVELWELLDAYGLTEVRMGAAKLEILRQLRNACREGFAYMTEEITPEQQKAWWAANRRRVYVWLYRDESGAWVGFGMLRQVPKQDPDRELACWYTTVAVHPDHAGHGYGGAITRLLVRHFPYVRKIGEARKDNPAACRLHCEADWRPLPESDPRLRRFITRPMGASLL